MIYLSGGTPPEGAEPLIERGLLGWMVTPRQINDPATIERRCRVWAADNDCFNQGERFDSEAWLLWLAALRPALASCLFAALPDVVGDAQATEERSLPFVPSVRALGYALAYVAQDGSESSGLPWDQFDVLFVGGSTEFKIGPAWEIIHEARRRGKPVHMGRVNSHKRFRAARAAGCDSADGTFLKFGPEVLLPRLQRWLDDLVLTEPPGEGGGNGG